MRRQSPTAKAVGHPSGGHGAPGPSRACRGLHLAGAILCCGLSGSLYTAHAGDTEPTSVTVTGEGLNAHAALMDALRTALEQGAGVQIASYSQTENFELIRDTIFSRAEGLVSSYHVLEKGPAAGGVFYCKISARVSRDAVARAWGEVQNVLSQIGRPRIMVYIAETVDSQSDTSSILESKIEERLVKLGFDVYDSTHLDALRSKEVAHAAKVGDEAKMASLAKGFGAQIFIMGSAGANRAEKTSPRGVNRVMYNCDVQAKVFYTDTGKLLASESLPSTRGGARGFSDFSRQAGKMAIHNAAGPLIDAIYETVMKSWATQISSGSDIRLEISGFKSVSGAYELKGRIKGIPGVVSVHGPEYADGLAIYRVKAKMTAQDMMEHLIGDEWSRLIEVFAVSLNRIQAKRVDQ